MKTSADRLPSVTASAVKTEGWRRIMKTVRAQGRLLVTNHKEAEAVIVAVDEYERLVARAEATERRGESDLVALRRQFDERLAALDAPDAGARLRSVMRHPARLRGKVKAGSGY